MPQASQIKRFFGVSPMPKRTLRADPTGLPKATPHPDAELLALAAEFEAACQAARGFYHGGGTDDESDAAISAAIEVAQRIAALPGKDISVMRLKARAYMHLEGEDLGQRNSVSDQVLVSLFRDLGVDRSATKEAAAVSPQEEEVEEHP